VGGFSDAEALRRLRRDPEAIGSLYDRHVARLVAALAAASGDRELAFELAQETFTRALECGHRVRVEEGRICRALVVDRRSQPPSRRAAPGSGRPERASPTGLATIAYDDQTIDDLIARVDAEELRSVLGRARSKGFHPTSARRSSGG
jgi:DNA-directed RNA polymerase specialized sigma24 family protein